MSETKRFKRESGVVMPIFSLPSPHGIGTFGKSAYDFVDKLAEASQRYWQILPLGHTGYGDSPYQTFSTVAGNPYFIDLDMLIEDRYLEHEEVFCYDYGCSDSKVNYDFLAETRFKILRIAYNRAKSDANLQKEIDLFVDENSDWLKDYALFMSLKYHFSQKPMWQWDDAEIKKRTPDAMQKYSELLKEDIGFFYFIQYLFFKQWKNLKKYANGKGILFIGDIPMYPSPDSADVWANRHLFKVAENLVCKKVAGVPPDMYSETGQLWGNPVYDWEVHKAEGYNWWINRIKHLLDVSDVIRIDHFRAFQDYWEIPGGDETALNGKWVPGPRMELITAIKNALGDVPIIAEDLGIITDSVRELLKETGYPGMNVIIFGINKYDDSTHLPHNWVKNSVGYTSTHDSEPFVFAVEKADPTNRDFILDYISFNPEKESLGMAAIRTVWASTAKIAMTMVADILSLGGEGRINTPSTLGGNWSWRLKPEALTDEMLYKLDKLTKLYKRNQ